MTKEEMRMNKTGAGMSPIDSAELVEGTQKMPSSPKRGKDEIARVRGTFVEESDHYGSIPPPATIKGAITTTLQALKGNRASVFLDRLGQRLAFERAGVRLYEGLIAKVRQQGSVPGGPTPERLEAIRADEASHFDLVRRSMLRLGGDPTAITPAANVSAVSSIGLIQVVADPRTDVLQTLEAIMTAELTDVAAWDLLANLATELGQKELAAEFRSAHAVEERHLEDVHGWISAMTLLQATGDTLGNKS